VRPSGTSPRRTPDRSPGQAPGSRLLRKRLDSGFRRNDEAEKASFCLKLTPIGSGGTFSITPWRDPPGLLPQTNPYESSYPLKFLRMVSSAMVASFSLSRCSAFFAAWFLTLKVGSWNRANFSH